MGVNQYMDYRNVTFRQLFITGTCLIFPIAFWNIVQIMTDFSKNNGILSLFLMLMLALVYVVLLHLALSGVVKMSDPAKEKTEITGAKVWNNKKKVAIASIYVIRYVIRGLFLLYFFVQGSRILMLPDYAETVLVVPVLLALFYMAGKGLRGYIGFAEASVIGIGITLVLFVICGFWNADFSGLKEYVELSNSNKFTIKVVANNKIIDINEFGKENLLNHKYVNYPVKEISENLVTIDASSMNRYICTFLAGKEEHELVVEAFNDEEAKLRGQLEVFRQRLFKGKLIATFEPDTIGPGEIKLVNLKKIKK